MKEAFYFSHDYNARTDTKIKKLLAKRGMVGYGVFWSIVEDLYNNANALRMDCESIAYDLRVECEMVESVLCDFDLFIIEGDIISSKSIEDRLNKRNEKSIKASESAKARWSHANALRSQSDGNAIKERKGKETKINIGKDEAYMQAGHLSISHEEFSKLEKVYGAEKSDEVVQGILNYRKNTKYKSLYLTALTWLKRDQKKIDEPVKKVKVTTIYE